jgi:hypothetical protein
MIYGIAVFLGGACIFAATLLALEIRSEIRWMLKRKAERLKR